MNAAARSPRRIGQRWDEEGSDYDEGKEVEPSVREGLSRLRDGNRFYLRFNRKGRCVARGSYDANGRSRSPVFQPRWEVWEDARESGHHYVMTVQTAEGNYREPGQWLIEHLEMFNPERYGGDLEHMLRTIERNSEKLRMGMEKSQLRAMGRRMAENALDQYTPSNISRDRAKASRQLLV